jgi:signal transduction histidine kinase
MHRWSLRTRFLLFALACLLPFGVALGYYLDRNLERARTEGLTYETTTASSVSRSLSTFLATNAEALDGISQLPNVVSLDHDKAEIDLGQARRMRPELSGIFLVDTEKTLVTFAGADPHALLTEIGPQLEQTINQNITTVSRRIPLDNDVSVVVLLVPVTTVQPTETSAQTETPATDTSGNDTVATTSVTPTPTTTSEQSSQPPGRTTGVLAGIIQVDRLSTAVLPSTRASTEIAVASIDSVLFATGGIDRATTPLVSEHKDLVQVAIDGEVTNFRMDDPNGIRRSVVAAPVSFEAAPWAVLVTQPTPRTFDGISRPEAAVVVVLCLLVIVAIAIVMAELTARPLRTLSRQAQELHHGTLKDPIVPLGGGEIRTLSERFSEMADQINNQVAGLEENRHERERQAAQMRDLLRRTNRLQEDERRRIASEIHDAVSPLITGALYQTRALQMTNGSTPSDELDASLTSVSELLDRATNELHGVIFDLRPPDLDDIGLVAAIEAFVQTIQRTGLSCRLEVIGEPLALTPEVRLSFYRIAQEALHNVVRHAGADEAVVRLETTAEVVRLTIRDNGAGFDPQEAVRPTSLGLLSMQERAESIGATLTVVSRPGGGTAVMMERPNTGDVMSDEVLESMMSMTSGTGTAYGDHEPDGEPATADTSTPEPLRQETAT